MQLLQSHRRSGSRVEGVAPRAPAWEREWVQARATDRAEAAEALASRRRAVLLGVAPAAVLAAALPLLLPYAADAMKGDTAIEVVVAALAALAAIDVVALVRAFAASRLRARAWTGRQVLVFGAALLSAGAAATHFSVAKDHFSEYTLYGVFFVGAGLAQLVWAGWVLLRPIRPVLLLGAVGNLLIVALWAVDRAGGMPIGPDSSKPSPIGFGDSVTAAFEILLAVACFTAIRRPGVVGRVRTPGASAAAGTLAAVVVVVTTLALLSAIGVGSSFLTPAG